MDNFHSNFMSYAPYQSNSRTGGGWSNRWDFHANSEDWFVRRYSAAICPTVSGTYEFKSLSPLISQPSQSRSYLESHFLFRLPYVDDMLELYIAPDDQIGFAAVSGSLC